MLQFLLTLVHPAKLVEIICRGLSFLRVWRTGNNAATSVANRQHANFCRTKVFTTETKIITETKVVTEIKLNLPAH